MTFVCIGAGRQIIASEKPLTPAAEIARARGLYDRLPEELAKLNQLQSLMTETITSRGYRMVETPTLEHTELFLRKSGGERISQLYNFQHRGRALALRPEHTASIMRVFVNQLQSEPLPLRLGYCGPVFRYESPQAGRSRQFTELGCELIGASGAAADTEIVDLAIDCVRRAGVEKPYVVLGHLGAVISYLNDLGLDHRVQDWLLWSMERMRRGDESVEEIPTYLAHDDVDDRTPESALTEEAARALIERLAPEVPPGGRTIDEVVRGLTTRANRGRNRPRIEKALALVRELIECAGPPQSAIPALRSIAERYGIQSDALNEVEQVCDALYGYWGDRIDIQLDFGLGRGLRYYTGLIFEIYPSDSDQLQLCGGGRYDDLATSLGARKRYAACGFSLGIERLLTLSTLEPDAPRPVVLVNGPNVERNLSVAAALREAGWVTELGARGRSESAAKRWAARRGLAAICIPGENEFELITIRDDRTITLREAPRPEDVLA